MSIVHSQWPRMTVALLACVVVVLCCAAGGCVKRRAHSLAEFTSPTDREAVMEPAPASAVYKVKWEGAPGVCTVRGSKRAVAEGQPLGFREMPEGRVLAMAGPETFELNELPPGAKYYWYYKTEDRLTALESAGRVAEGAAGVTAAVAGTVLSEALDFDEEEDDDVDERPSWDNDRRKKSRLGPKPDKDEHRRLIRESRKRARELRQQ